MDRARTLVICLIALLAVQLPGVAAAVVMNPPAPYRAKDFTIVKRDGVFHLFYIRNDTTLPLSQTERDLGHATSLDMFTWVQQPPVLTVRDSSWDNRHVWAPHIVEDAGVYYMFYAGVTDIPGTYNEHQRIGVATSTDLVTWTRSDAPILGCSDLPWALCDPLSPGTGVRDPFVMRDPTDSARWIMLHAGQRADLPGSMSAAWAAAPSPTGPWSDFGQLTATHVVLTGSDLVESPHMFERNGTWYLMWTGNGAVPLEISTGADPLGGEQSWTWRGSIDDALGYSVPWIASEYLQDGLTEYIAYVYGDRIEFRRLYWNTDWTFVLLPPNAFRVVRMYWDRASASPGEVVQLTIETVNGFGSTMQLEGAEVDAFGEEPLALASLGLPTNPTVTDNTMTFDWTVPSIPDVDTDGEGAEVVIRDYLQTAVTPVLSVLPAGTPPVDPGAGGGDKDHDDGFKLRFLPHSPLGRDGGFLVELPQATRVSLDVFDLQGRRVRNLADRTMPAGASVLPWDERAEAGAPLGAGVYFARMRAGDQVRTTRVYVSAD